MIKYHGAAVMHDVLDQAIQMHGSLGFSADMPLEEMYRWARAARLYDGPDEVHKVTVARKLLKEYKPVEVPTEHIPTRTRGGAGDVRRDGWRPCARDRSCPRRGDASPAWVNRATDVRLDESTATLERLAGGNSNETYLLSDGHRTPRGAAAAAAHAGRVRAQHEPRAPGDPGAGPDPGAQRAARSATATTPRCWAVDFLVSEYLPDSVSLHDVLPEAYEPGAASLEPLGHALVDVLAQVQAVDWRAAGLEGFGRPDGFLERQVPRWEAQYRKHQVRDLADFDRVTAWLADSLPAEQPAAIMHGDFHLDNCLFSARRPELLAVVDWEMATIGDPLVDLGLCLAFWGPRLAEPLAMPRVQGVSREPGAPTREALAERYAAASGRDLTHVRWYQAFALWKLAVVIEPAYGQHVARRAGHAVRRRAGARRARAASPRPPPSPASTDQPPPEETP